MNNDDRQLAEIGVCQAAWSMENTLLQAYRGLCAAIEAFLLGTGMILLNSFAKSGPFWVVFGVGLAVAVFWIVVCTRRADIAEIWSREVIARATGEIVILDKDTIKTLEAKGKSLGSPYEYELTKPSLWLSGFLNWGVPLVLIVVWVLAAVFLSPSATAN
ncbi:hypothetical protein ES703_109658 [subsurface metagenome]